MDGPFDNFAVALGQNLHFYAFFFQKVEKLTTDLGQFSKVFVFAKKEAFFADYSNRQSFPKCEKFTRYLWVPYVAVNKLINGTAAASWLVHYYLWALWTMEF